MSPAGKQIILALANGWTLKSHRYIDGSKIYQLHPLDGSTPENIPLEIIETLRNAGYIDSNKKFPAATYLLTERGRQQAEILMVGGDFPLTATGWLPEDGM